MMVKKSFGVASVTALLIATPLVLAHAADMPLKAPPMAVASSDMWSGWYIGGNFGYGDPGGTDISATNSGTFGGTFGSNLRSVTTSAIPTSVGTDPHGFLGGGQIGYNWRAGGQFVLGLEADIQWSDIKGSSSSTASALSTTPTTMGAIGTATASQHMGWFGTVRPRVGILLTPTLLGYVTGGLAYGEVSGSTTITETCLDVCNPLRSVSGSASTTNVGWTVGGGAEWALDRRWSIKAEYLHVDLGSLSYADGAMHFDGPLSVVNTSSTAHFNNDIARVGLNLHY